MTMPDGPLALEDGAAADRPIDTSDIPETLPGTAFGPASDIMVRARERARRAKAEGRLPTEGFPTLLALEAEVAERLLALGPDWQSRANEVLRKAFVG